MEGKCMFEVYLCHGDGKVLIWEGNIFSIAIDMMEGAKDRSHLLEGGYVTLVWN